MDVKLPFQKKSFQSLLRTLAISCVSSYALISNAANQDYFEIRYLNPDVWSTVVTEDHCFHAAPKSLLEVEPINNEKGQRVYKISQYSDIDIQKSLFAKPLEAQISDRKIVGEKFCNGIVSSSDMNYPFTKGSGIDDANDGLLLADYVHHAISNIMEQLYEMKVLANDAVTGTYSSSMLGILDHKFQLRMGNINETVFSSWFNRIPLLDGSQQYVDIPVDGRKKHLIISLTSMKTGDYGLGLDRLSLFSNHNAYESLEPLARAETYISSTLDRLKEERRLLELAAEHDAVTTSIDVRTDKFTVQRKGPSTLTEQGSKK